MKQYIKTSEGLEQVAQPKVRVYDSISDLEADLADTNTTLKEGDIVTTEFVEGAEDIESAVEVVNDAIVEMREQIDALPTADITDSLQAQITSNSDNISSLAARVTANESNISDNSADISQIQSVMSSSAATDNKLTSVTDVTNMIANGPIKSATLSGSNLYLTI